jgi:phosphoglycerate dehydrogenase-like enzyme
MSNQGTTPRPLRVAILDDYQEVARQYADWSSLPPGSEVRFFRDHLSSEDDLVLRLVSFEAVVAMRERTPFPRSLLARLPNLRLLVTTGARNAAIDVAAAAERGITVAGTEGLPYPTAELTWALILALARQVPAEDLAVRAGHWQTSVGTGLQGKILALLGLGRLGTQVARIGRAFGMRVIAWSPNLTAARAENGGAELVSRDELFRQADVLSIHLVLSEKTRALVGVSELGLFKKSALLVNTSRGPIIDEGALIAALSAGALGGAGLDVFDVEPLPANHPFLSLKNTVLTPHLGYVTSETYRIFYTQALEDIRGYLAGKTPRVILP